MSESSSKSTQSSDKLPQEADDPSTYRKFSSPSPSEEESKEGEEGKSTYLGILRPENELSPGHHSSPGPSADRLSVSFVFENEREGDPNVNGEEGNIVSVINEVHKEDEETNSPIAHEGRGINLAKLFANRELKANVSEDQKSEDSFDDSVLDIPKFRKNSRRRGSSIFTTSSMDSFGLTSARDRSENELKINKEVIDQAKYQFWPLEKKLKIIVQAKEYVKWHKNEIEERLAQSRTVGSIFKQSQIFLVKCISSLWKFLIDFLNQLTPWQRRIKDIESHFGSVVSSYFVFLRWIFWMNLTITITILVFVMIPEVISMGWEGTGARKTMLPVEKIYSMNLKVMWNFEGIFRYSPIFYGFYEDARSTKIGYRLPLAYFLVGMSVYIYSFVIILRKMAYNSKQSKLSEKGDECTFSWKIFASWDFGIANVETAHNKVASIIMGLREALVERLEKEKQLEKNWKIIAKRICANFIVLGILVGTAYAVVLVVERSESPEAASSWYRQNEITIIMSLISLVVPNFFDLISLLEAYHPRKAMRWMLGRIMVLNLLSLYTLIFALFGKTDGMIQNLAKMEVMRKGGMNFGIDLDKIPQVQEINRDCFRVPLPCDLLSGSNETLSLPSISINRYSSSNSSKNSPDLFGSSLRDMEKLDCKRCLDVCMANCTVMCHSFRLCDDLEEMSLNSSNVVNDSEDNDTCLSCFIMHGNKKPKSSPIKASKPEGICNVKICKNHRSLPVSIENITNINTIKPEKTLDKCSVAINKYSHDIKEKIKLRKLCWETMFGQELVKLTIMDTIFTLFSILIVDFGRSLFLRYINPCWFWDLEKQFPKYPDFKVAENILHLVNNQGMIWMGLFMAPGLPAINLLKLVIIMNARCWAVMTSNVPHETVFKAGSNNFYFVLLLQMLFLCTLPVAYTIVWLKPSWHCGPFSKYDRIYKVLSELIIYAVPKELHGVLDYISSPGVVIPVFLLLTLIIYYQFSLTALLRESNEDLKNQLHYERTEERRKLLQSKQVGNKKSQDVQDRWKKLLQGGNTFGMLGAKSQRRISGLSEKTVNQELPSITYDDEAIIDNISEANHVQEDLIPFQEEEDVPVIHISNNDDDHDIIEILSEEDFGKTVLI